MSASEERPLGTSTRLAQTSVQLSHEVLATIDRLARERGWSRALMVRELVRLGLDRYLSEAPNHHTP